MTLKNIIKYDTPTLLPCLTSSNDFTDTMLCRHINRGPLGDRCHSRLRNSYLRRNTKN